MNKSTIRPAVKEEAPQIAELFMLAWPVDETIESQPNHQKQPLRYLRGLFLQLGQHLDNIDVYPSLLGEAYI